MVSVVGVEPTRLSAIDFESTSSAYSNIPTYSVVCPTVNRLSDLYPWLGKVKRKEVKGLQNPVVGAKGFEPSRYFYQRILSPLRTANFATPPYRRGFKLWEQDDHKPLQQKLRW